MDSVLRLENRHTGETLRMRRERDVSGQVVLIIEGSLPPGTKGPPPHVHLEYRRGLWAHELENKRYLCRPEEMQLFLLGSFTLGGMPGKPFWSSMVA